jgi:hypothetical protein
LRMMILSRLARLKECFRLERHLEEKTNDER